MKNRLFIFMNILAISSAHAMDIKKHTPQLQNINDKQTLITFKKKTKTFEYWMFHRKNTTFGENRLFEYVDQTKGLTPINSIKLPENNRTSICLAYISNLEKRYVEPTKYVMLGALVLYDTHILKDNYIKIVTDYYTQNIPQPIRPQKPLRCEKKEKKPQERGSVLMEELFTLIETHGTPSDLEIVTTTEDWHLLQNPFSQEAPAPEEVVSLQSSKSPKRIHFSLSRRPSGNIPKLSARNPTIRKNCQDKKSS
jgi:hypothetical protein